MREDLRWPFLDETVVKREARTASVTPRRNGHAHDLGFVAWIHPLNLASAVLSFKSQVVGRAGHHAAEFSRSPRRRQGSRFARPAQAGCGLDDDSVERRLSSYVMAGDERVLEAGWPIPEDHWLADEVPSLDESLRGDGNRRNPGTSADLVTASLFVLLREGTIESPSQYPWNLPSKDE